MPVSRGLIPPALVTSAIALFVCCVSWGALGVLSFVAPAALSTAAHRYLSMLLATLTILSMMVYLTARIVRTIHKAVTATDDGYAAGYTDGLSAAPTSPAVSRLVPTRR